jgi:hypothetical protein
MFFFLLSPLFLLDGAYAIIPHKMHANGDDGDVKSVAETTMKQKAFISLLRPCRENERGDCKRCIY